MIDSIACIHQLRDLLECVWPAVLDTAAHPFKSATWQAGLAVVLARCAGDPSRLRRLGLARFTTAIRRELPRWGAIRPCLRIVNKIFDALADHTGVAAHRRGALERADLLIEDWLSARQRLADVEQRMLAVLDELGLTDLVTSIPGLSPVSAAAILAETGDPGRFHSPRALVKHAGLAPREQTSAYTGRTRISGRGRRNGGRLLGRAPGRVRSVTASAS